MRALGLHTVCEEANCPNIGECWHHGTATFMILGDTCTRSCGYCNVTHGTPQAARRRRAGQGRAAPSPRLALDYVVVTSVDRDDLPDCGASHFARTIAETRAPDSVVPARGADPRLQGRRGGAAHRARRAARRAQPQHRDRAAAVSHRAAGRPLRPRARSCSIARARYAPAIPTKSGLMVGLGEEWDEVVATLRDLRAAGCQIVTIGQYLRPSLANLPMVRYYTPAEFAELKRLGARDGLRPRRIGPARPQLLSRPRADAVLRSGRPVGGRCHDASR